jgi:NUMOD3 motif
MLEYLNLNYLTSYTSMPICSALLKYGYSNFSLNILEYCKEDILLVREKYYIDLLKPEYNISQEPGSPMLGRKHSEETIQKMKEISHAGHFKSGEQNPMFGRAGDKNPMFGSFFPEGAPPPPPHLIHPFPPPPSEATPPHPSLRMGGGPLAPFLTSYFVRSLRGDPGGVLSFAACFLFFFEKWGGGRFASLRLSGGGSLAPLACAGGGPLVKIFLRGN